MVRNFAGKRDPMPFTLITSKGSIMTFYIEQMAILYQNLYGGKIVTKSILEAKQLKTEMVLDI